jgi:hypothetical protein
MTTTINTNFEDYVSALTSNFYTGIGSRKTPRPILTLMEKLGEQFAKRGLTLRSGGAPGADSAFEKGCDAQNGKKEIFIPWKNFNKNSSNLTNPIQGAYELAKEIHPNWLKCSKASQKLHARNIHQVLGKDLKTPTSFIIYWAEIKNGQIKGGTATAVNLAKKLNIQSFNLADKKIEQECKKYINLKENNEKDSPKVLDHCLNTR